MGTLTADGLEGKHHSYGDFRSPARGGGDAMRWRCPQCVLQRGMAAQQPLRACKWKALLAFSVEIDALYSLASGHRTSAA